MTKVCFLATLVAAAAAGCVYAPVDLNVPSNKTEEETVVDSGSSNKIVLVRVDGEITDQPRNSVFETNESTTAIVKEALDRAKKDEDVKGIVLRIDSPGGGVTASDIVYKEILNWKRETKKPVVAILMDVAASGGYYIAQSADAIIAHPSSITGSIGVVAMLLDVQGLGEKIGVTVHVFKSGAYKDMGNPFRKIEEPERVVFQKLVDDLFQKFVGVVADGRSKAGLTREDVLKLADGRIYTAEDANAARLVDKTGYISDAIDQAKVLAKIEDAKVVTYVRRGFLSPGQATVYSHASAETAPSLLRANVDGGLGKMDPGRLLPRERPMFNYLWIPN